MSSIAEQQNGDLPPSPPDGAGKNENRRPFLEFWKTVDTNHDGFLIKDEFDALPRVQKIPEDKRIKLFKRLDKNGDDKIEREELAELGNLREGQGRPLPRLWELDVDKSGGITFDEFKAGKMIEKLPAEKQKALFERLDTNHDGIISPKDKPEHPFKPEGDDQGPKRPNGESMPPRQMIRQLDTDKDGALSFSEFRLGPMIRNLSEDEQERRFEALDKNHDQKLSPEDLPPPPMP
ncbi:MAG: EF-hand domain-containing protein [Gloeobacteraceae cyanobacterium ES-bin-144]|nr:EF-hand domain-containing protein [Verrucomicrobiales bacterium]